MKLSVRNTFVLTSALLAAIVDSSIANGWTYTSSQPGNKLSGDFKSDPQNGVGISVTLSAPYPSRLYYAVNAPPSFGGFVISGSHEVSAFHNTSGPGSSYPPWYGTINTSFIQNVNATLRLTADGSIGLAFGGTSSTPEPAYAPDEKSTIYIPPGAGEGEIEEDADVANDTTGGYLIDSTLTTPVVGEHGLTDMIWVKAATANTPSNPEPWKPGYFFVSDVAFTKFTIPEALPGGDSEFELVIGEYERYTLQAGTVFDFTAHFPEGVTAFLLTDLNNDPGLIAGQAFPYTHGYQFATSGLATVQQGPLRPGDFTLGGLVDWNDLDVWRESFGVDDGGDADGDGDTDGNDFLVWQRNFFNGEELVPPAASVPEPTGITLAALIAAAMCCQRRIR